MRIRSLSLVSCLALLPLAALLSGCAMTETASPTPTTSKLTVQGVLHGGQQPVVGAHVYLYQAGSSGYGGPGILPSTSNASISKLTAAANTLPDTNGNYYTTTNSAGSFTLTGDYTCTTGQQLYVYAVGGYQGSVANLNNAGSFLTVLGACPAAGASGLASAYVYMNEVSTVISAYALGGFASDATHISSGSSALALQGIANAFKIPANMINQSTATANTPSGPGLGTLISGSGQYRLDFVNTMSNILASCVNSTGSTAAGSACGTLFANTLYSNSTKPTETASAMINIVHAPGANLAALYALAGSGPFLPQFTSQPNDFMLAVTYAGAVKTAQGADGTYNIAIDGAGNIWATNVADSSILQLNPLGAPFVTGSTGYYNSGFTIPTGIAIDPNGNAWSSGAGTNNLFEVASGGNQLGLFPASGASNGGINRPQGITIGPQGDVWVVNGFGNGGSTPANSVSRFNRNGVAVSPATTGYTGGGLSSPKSIAMSGQEYVWVGNGNNSLSVFNPTGTPAQTTAYTGGGLNNPLDIAFDSSNNVWVANASGNSISAFTSAGVPISSTGYSGGGLNQPSGIAIDGAGNVWVGNQVGGASNVNGSISVFAGTTSSSTVGTALSPTTGFGTGYVFSPQDVQIDGSGNVWIANYGSTTTVGADSAITQFVGAAVPRITPLSVAIASNQLGTRP